MKEELMDRIIKDKFENLKENKLDNIEVPSVFHNWYRRYFNFFRKYKA